MEKPSQCENYCKTPISPTSDNVSPIAPFRLKNQMSRTRSQNLSPIERNKLDDKGKVVRNKARSIEEDIYVLKKKPSPLKIINTLLMFSKLKNVDTTKVKRISNNYFIIVKVYVNDIIFYITNESVSKIVSKLMQSKFQISHLGELEFFLSLQIN
ncbi:hypothetical protein Lal_00001143 [Lupinus albus]|nr:hypothetical protein Lal_00001143 [Lupinus albus]